MLDAILDHKRAELAIRHTPARLRALRAAASPTDRSLRAALVGAGPGFILECKTAAPSTGRLRAGFPFTELVAAFAPFAAAISVLTDARHFGGALDHLALVRDRVPQPVLCKDFLLVPEQVLEARAHGADAVLLMLSVLDDEGWRSCAAAARALGMDVLTEVHTMREMQRALDLGATLIGINNRDLRSLTVDLAVTERLADMVPPGVTLITESGVNDRRDLRRLAPRIDGCLVGSSLMRRPDLAGAVRELVFGRVKVCGLTRATDAAAAWTAGATHGGFNFIAGSPRRIDFATAMVLRKSAPLAWVGVFADAPAAEVAAMACHLNLAAVQLHGDEDAAYAHELRAGLPADCELWKAVQVTASIPDPAAFAVDRLVLDAPHPTLKGGTGRRFDWGLLVDLPARERYIVAGGLDATCVAAADALGVHALDLNSGVESAPGCKDAHRLAACLGALRAAPGRRGARA